MIVDKSCYKIPKLGVVATIYKTIIFLIQRKTTPNLGIQINNTLMVITFTWFCLACCCKIMGGQWNKQNLHFNK